MAYEHVHEKFRHFCVLPNEERLAFLHEPRWVGYPRADEVVDTLLQLLERPKRPRMPSLLVVGEPNNGKTTTVRRFIDAHGAGYVNEDDEPVKPVIYANSPPSAEEAGLYKSILEQFFAPYSETSSASRLRYKVIDQLRSCHVKMIILDEIHNLLNGSAKDQRTCRNAIKFISNELMIPIIGVGTRDAITGLHSDEQYASRFKVLDLPKWEIDQNFQKVLASFEKILPLKKPSRLHEPAKASNLHHICGGNTGNLHELLVECAKVAIKSGKEEIDNTTIKELSWFRPTRGIRAQV